MLPPLNLVFAYFLTDIQNVRVKMYKTDTQDLLLPKYNIQVVRYPVFFYPPCITISS